MHRDLFDRETKQIQFFFHFHSNVLFRRQSVGLYQVSRPCELVNNNDARMYAIQDRVIVWSTHLGSVVVIDG